MSKLSLVGSPDEAYEDTTPRITYPDRLGYLCMDKQTGVVSIAGSKSLANLRDLILITVNKDGEVFEVVKR